MSQSNLILDSDTEEKREENRSLGFLGIEFRRKKTKQEQEKSTRVISPVPAVQENEPGYLVTASGYYGQVLDVRGDAAKTERDLLVKYRNAALQPECDSAIEDIVNEAIVADDKTAPISLNLDLIEDEILDEKTKEVIHEEFDEVIRLLDFKKYGHDIFRRWYIDGKIIYHKVIDLNNVKKGIEDLRPMNPIKVQKISEIDEKIDDVTGIKLTDVVDEYFVFSDDGFGTENQANISSFGYNAGQGGGNGVKLSKDSVSYITSGLSDASKKWSLSYLHKALKSVNQLRMMEDALVIYRLARAPERRLFSIDIGGMNEKKGMEYVQQIMNQYRNKIQYDARTGEVRQDGKHMSMLEDYWIPTRDGAKGAQITTLAGGQNLGQIDDIVYFQKAVYKALNVPINRLDNETGFNIGRTQEISRDELKFQKFIHRLRTRFGELFKDILKTQLILKEIISLSDWDDIKENVVIDYAKDSYFGELKEAEILRERITSLQAVEAYIGRYFSEEFVYKSILQMDDDAIKEMRRQMYDEAIRRRTQIALPDDDAGQGDFAPEPGAGPQPTNIPGATPSGEGPGLEGGGGPEGPAQGQNAANAQDTGLGGINDVPVPPGQPGPGEEGDEADLGSEQEPNEPTINPQGGDFPDFEEDEEQPKNRQRNQ